MLPGELKRKQARRRERVSAIVAIVLILCAIGFVGHMDFEDQQIKASAVSTR